MLGDLYQVFYFLVVLNPYTIGVSRTACKITILSFDKILDLPTVAGVFFGAGRTHSKLSLELGRCYFCSVACLVR